jgi:phosphatidylglycerophosphate synthase
MKEKVTCYSDGEGRFMDWSQEFRARWLKPLLEHLADLGLRGNHITFFSMIAGLGFCPAYLFEYKVVAFGLLFLHVLLDGLDGPLARFLGQASNRGSFTDTMADQIVVTVTALTLVHTGDASAWSGGLYVFFYAVVVGFALVRNALAAPYSWLFRPRFIIYAWFVAETCFWPGTLDVALWIASGILGAKAITGFLMIRQKI